jgi:hypothetical protein
MVSTRGMSRSSISDKFIIGGLPIVIERIRAALREDEAPMARFGCHPRERRLLRRLWTPLSRR